MARQSSVATVLSGLLVVLEVWSLGWWRSEQLPPSALQSVVYLVILVLVPSIIFASAKVRGGGRWFIWPLAVLGLALFIRLAYIVYSAALLTEK